MKNVKILTLFLGLVLMMASCSKKNPLVEIQTPQGKIIVELFVDKAPITAGHFLDLVKKGIYDEGSFYRVVRGNNDSNPINIAVLQGGVRDKKGLPPIDTIAHETTAMTGIRHLQGTLSMARSRPGTARTEFFFCLRDEPELDFGGLRNPDGQGFAAFGKVVEGEGVVYKIYQGRAAGQQLDPTVRIHKIIVK